MESEISSIEKRFAYGFLQKLLKWMEIAQEFIAHLGMAWMMDSILHNTVTPDRVVSPVISYFALCFTEAVVSSGRVEKSPHEQEIKFFAKVKPLFRAREDKKV